MRTNRKIEIIKVTEDFRTIDDAGRACAAEARHQNYKPLLYVDRIKGQIVACVCRIADGADDQALISNAKLTASQNGRKDTFVAIVDPVHLFRWDAEGEILLPWEGGN